MIFSTFKGVGVNSKDSQERPSFQENSIEDVSWVLSEITKRAPWSPI